MKRFLLCMLGAASVLASGGCAGNREQPTSIFSPLYAGKKDDVIQREIYHAARDKKPISPQTLDKIERFFANSEPTETHAEQYAETQKEIYFRILQRESAEKMAELGFDILGLYNMKETRDYHFYLPSLLDKLKMAHRSLDPAYKGLDEAYQSIADKLIEKR